MSTIQTQPNSNQDNLLADFTDSALTGRMETPASTLDSDLISLEKTILRLRESFPPVQLNDVAINGMYAKLNARIRREERQTKESFWQKWFGQFQIVPQFGVAFAAVAAIVLLVIVSSSTGSSGSSLSATAVTSGQSLVFTGVLVGAVIFILWKTRRKK